MHGVVSVSGQVETARGEVETSWVTGNGKDTKQQN